jgi:hypothetical protein
VNQLDPNIIIEISSKISAIDERTRALQAADAQAQVNADHRHRNVMAAIETFVPRREIEAEHKAIRAYAEELAQDARDHCDTNREAVLTRVSDVEGSLGDIHKTAKSLRNWILSAIGSGFLGGLGLLATHFLHLKGWAD